MQCQLQCAFQGWGWKAHVLLQFCLQQALQELEYPEKLQRLLQTPQREVLTELVITRDNGEIETYNAYRVQHDNSRGPFKGGLRYHSEVNLDDVRRYKLNFID